MAETEICRCLEKSRQKQKKSVDFRPTRRRTGIWQLEVTPALVSRRFIMRYLLLIYDEEAAWNDLPAEEQNRFMSEYGAFSKAIKESKAMVGANRLRPVASATTVRVRQGRTL